MARKPPLVSIGMPVYNGQEYVGEAIESILGQTLTDFELIISDNCSEDGTEDTCRELAAQDDRIAYARNSRNLGASPNYNLVFERSTGRYFKWATHDDRCGETYLERCVEALEATPDVSLAFPRIAYIDPAGQVLRNGVSGLDVTGDGPAERVREMAAHQLASVDMYWSVFGLMRADALRTTQRIEGFVGTDHVLLLELVLRGKFRAISEPLYFRREHADASMAKHRTPEERATWHEPGARAGTLLPHWRILREMLRGVTRARLPLTASLRCSYEVLRYYSKRWRILGGEIKRCPARLVARTSR